MKKLYLFLAILFLSTGVTCAFAQDSSGCNAAFSATVSGNTVFFRAMDSMPGVRHSWFYGDGGSTFTDSFAVTHHYGSAGSYVVTHVVTDTVHHCRDSVTQLVNLTPHPTTCSVYVTETGDTAHHQYTFVANIFVTPGASDTVRWTINDTLVGTGDTLQRHLTGGPYTVCAFLSTSYSCQSQSCLTINPQDSIASTPPPPPDTCTIAFTATPKDHKPNQYVFTVVDGANYDSINWTIIGPDSLFAGPYHGSSFTYTFRDTGYYVIYVTADKRSGCFVSNAQAVHIDSIAEPPGTFINSYPNPATTQSTLSVVLSSNATINVRIYNSMGGLTSSKIVAGSPGVNSIVVPVASLPIGIYYIEVQYGDTILRSKIQKL
jgi:hypothetical protein